MSARLSPVDQVLAVLDTDVNNVLCALAAVAFEPARLAEHIEAAGELAKTRESEQAPLIPAAIGAVMVLREVARRGIAPRELWQHHDGGASVAAQVLAADDAQLARVMRLLVRFGADEPAPSVDLAPEDEALLWALAGIFARDAAAPTAAAPTAAAPTAAAQPGAPDRLPDELLLIAAEKEMAALVEAPDLQVRITQVDAFQLIGLLQLALAHPGVDGSHPAALGRRLVSLLEESIVRPGCWALREMVRRGWQRDEGPAPPLFPQRGGPARA